MNLDKALEKLEQGAIDEIDIIQGSDYEELKAGVQDGKMLKITNPYTFLGLGTHLIKVGKKKFMYIKVVE